MSISSMTPPTYPARSHGWIRSWWWDTTLVSGGWIPFYVWILTTPLARQPVVTGDHDRSLAIALGLALAINFAHRHLVLLIVYGDPLVRAKRARAYVVAPLLALTLVSLALRSALHQHRFSLAFVVYFSTTSALHYLYDGWVWRMREPDVARPLVRET